MVIPFLFILFLKLEYLGLNFSIIPGKEMLISLLLTSIIYSPLFLSEIDFSDLIWPYGYSGRDNISLTPLQIGEVKQLGLS